MTVAELREALAAFPDYYHVDVVVDVPTEDGDVWEHSAIEFELALAKCWVEIRC
jgi:hypothetical protein